MGLRAVGIVFQQALRSLLSAVSAEPTYPSEPFRLFRNLDEPPLAYDSRKTTDRECLSVAVSGIVVKRTCIISSKG